MTKSGRIAIFGDVHGHASTLRDALVNLGMDPQTHRLPEDLTVVQLGDLVHRGPDSSAAIQLVDGILREQPSQWVQLVGNHEAQYVHEEVFEWDETLPDTTQAVLRGWWRDGLMRPAVALTTVEGSEALVTHAGLTADTWRILLGQPRSAQDAANRICAGVKHEVPWLWQPGEMLTGTPDRFAGPVWASAAGEVYPSWLAAEKQDLVCPFNQVHGHSSPYVWPTPWSQGWWRAGGPVRQRMVVDVDRRHTRAHVAGSVVLGIDPAHGKRPAPAWAPLTLRGVVHEVAPVTPPSMEWLMSA